MCMCIWLDHLRWPLGRGLRPQCRPSMQTCRHAGLHPVRHVHIYVHAWVHMCAACLLCSQVDGQRRVDGDGEVDLRPAPLEGADPQHHRRHAQHAQRDGCAHRQAGRQTCAHVFIYARADSRTTTTRCKHEGTQPHGWMDICAGCNIRHTCPQGTTAHRSTGPAQVQFEPPLATPC